MFSGSRNGLSPGLNGAIATVIDYPGVVALEPGRDYWVTNASAQLVLPDWADRPITIRNKTGVELNLNSTGRQFDFGGTLAKIASGAAGSVLVAPSGRWLTIGGVVFPAVTQSFSYTGSNQSFTVPNFPGAILELSAIGAGGGGGLGVGGGGGGVLARYLVATTSDLANGRVAAGSTVIVVVGQAGAYGGTANRFGGGGRGGGGEAGSGGGYSGFFAGSVSVANVLAIAGGGGGGSNQSNRAGGAGGGSSGQNGFGEAPGAGGTQSAAGTTGSGTVATASAQLQGAGISDISNGGGGGGWWGGGGGLGGGGGSAYFRTSVQSGSVLTAGSGQTPATVAGITGVGQGGAISGNGQNGAALIRVVAA